MLCVVNVASFSTTNLVNYTSLTTTQTNVVSAFDVLVVSIIDIIFSFANSATKRDTFVFSIKSIDVWDGINNINDSSDISLQPSHVRDQLIKIFLIFMYHLYSTSNDIHCIILIVTNVTTHAVYLYIYLK